MHKRYMSLWFPMLKTDWKTIRQPELAKVPFVFSTSEKNRLIISACNSVARSSGLHVGMRLADAKAILPDLCVQQDSEDRELKLLKAIGEWCIRYTPLVSLDLPDGLIFDCTGCTHLWGGEENYIREIKARFKSKGYTVRAAIADTIGAAWAMARFSKSTVIEPRSQKLAMSNLPPSALRLDDVTLDKLRKLGFRTIHSFSAIPKSNLRRRFGDLLLLRLMQAYGEVEENFKPLNVPEPYQERLAALEPIRTRVGIEIAIRELLNVMCNRLVGEGKGIRNAVLKTFRIDGKQQSIDIGTNQATCNVDHLFKLFEQKIETIRPALGIELFVLEVTLIGDADISQKSLWTGKTGLVDNGVLELLDKLAGKVGSKAIRRYLPQERYWPERSIKQTNDLKEIPQTYWPTDALRPTQLLSKPEVILVTAPIPDYPPMNFRYKDDLHIVKRADGPERIEREWWLDKGEHRDYYIVEDQHGKRYWLYRSGHYGADQTQWFLHGFFA